MVNRLLRTISVLTLMAAGSAAAVELGDLTLISGGANGSDSNNSGELTPFEVRIDIHDVGNLSASQLQISVADLDAYNTLALERNPALDSLSLSLIHI